MRRLLFIGIPVVVVLACAFTVLPRAVADAAVRGPCFAGHLREAMALNRERAAGYAALSDGQSRSLSRLLIGSEALTMGLAVGLEAAAAPYWHAGIPILCADFVPMDGAAPMQTRLGANPPELERFLE